MSANTTATGAHRTSGPEHRSRRKRLLVAAVLLIAVASTASTSSAGADQAPRTSAHPSAQVERAADAYVWGYPLVVTERTLQSLAVRAPVNRLTFQPAISGLTTRTIVRPNTDTLYAVAPLDLRGEPYVLTVPAIRDRYYAFQLISAYTDSFAYIGTRATGGRAGRWAITPPGWHGRLPAGTTRLESPTPQLLVLGRFLVVDDADVARVHALAARMSLAPLSTTTGAPAAPAPPPIGAPPGTPQSVEAAGAGFFEELGDVLAINPPVDPLERRTLRRFADLGVGPGRHPSRELQGPRRTAVLAAGVRLGQRRITAAESRAKTVNGWSVGTHVGTYGHDALARAVVAAVGWGANVPAEATYAHSTKDTRGTPYSGVHRYVVHFSRSNLPPVNAFWSLTMYGPDQFFVANSINRYAVGDRTPGLRYGKDGSLEIFIQHDPPVGHESNWLPAPSGRFSLSLRLYLPKRVVRAGHYEYPNVRQLPRSGDRASVS